MSDDLSAVDSRQLEAWAFGRAAVDSEAAAARAEASQLELRRRADALAEAARVDAARATAEQHAIDGAAAGDRPGADRAPFGEDADGEHPESPESIAAARHRQRMRATGLVGVAAAVLGLGVVSTALSAPNPDPLAIFDRPETQEDREWVARLAQGFIDDLTLGPRAIDLDEGIVAVVFRAAAVADGRSTEYDPYCLFTSDRSSDQGTTISGGACALPERFAAEGLVAPARASASGSDVDVVVWGPSGQPRVELDRTIESIVMPTSVLDWMAYASFSAPISDPLAIVDEPDRLLLGPASLPLIRTEASTLDVETLIYLSGNTSDSAGPVFCAYTLVPDEEETRVCALLSTVRRQGLEYTVTADGQEWVMSIGADGAAREDTMRAAD